MIHESAIAESNVAPTRFRPEFSHSLDPGRSVINHREPNGNGQIHFAFRVDKVRLRGIHEARGLAGLELSQFVKMILIVRERETSPRSAGVANQARDS